MFDINLPEFAVIAVIAVIVIGPQRLPHYAQQIGRFVREARKMAMGLREQVRDELGPEFDDVDWRKLDPRQYDPRRIIREALTEAWEEDETDVDPVADPRDDAAAEQPRDGAADGQAPGVPSPASAADDAADDEGTAGSRTGTDHRASTDRTDRTGAPTPVPFDGEAT